MAQLIKENVVCCICGASARNKYAHGWDFEYGTTEEEFSFQKCSGCGHVYLAPRPAKEELGVIYPRDYYAYDLEKTVNPMALRVKKFLEKRKVRALLKYCRTAHPRCLDVGCGDGRILDLLHDEGVPAADLCGIELSDEVVARLKAKGYNGFSGELPAADLPDASFDLIVMFQVLEHVDDPAAHLKICARLLKPGGVLIIETPNIESLDARLFSKRYWGGYHFPRHWNLFSAQTLERLGRTKAGLIAEKWETFVCAVFWVYPFHHFLREKKAPRWLYRLFWPARCLPLLAVFTLVDMALAPFKLSANLRMIFRKEA